jgi:uncharacterized membrane protein YfcA
MEYIIICIVALVASGLTLFSGFGLGTILVPVFALFFPVDMAIALTAIVHFLNNLFKLGLLGKSANKNIVLKFGIPSIVFAFLGALCLSYISGFKPIYSYGLWGKEFFITPVKVLISVLILAFALLDILPSLSTITFDKKYLPLGGMLSGFFGGLSGNQGALRSAFLIRAGLTKEVFVATGVVIACLTDISRLTVYTGRIVKVHDRIDYWLIILATLSAFLGAYIGNKVIGKITVRTLHIFVAVMLIAFSFAIGSGII